MMEPIRPARPRSWRRGLARRVLALAALGGLATLGISFSIFLSQMEGGEPGRHAEGEVALTGGQDRISEAVELLARGAADRLLITGVNPSTSKAHLARQTPQFKSLFECCIALGYEAANTVGNAAETGRWVRANRIHSLIVVTSNYHMPRALAEIASVLPDVDLIAFPVVPDHERDHPWWEDGARTRLVLIEYAKYLVTQVRIVLRPPNPDGAREAAAR